MIDPGLSALPLIAQNQTHGKTQQEPVSPGVNSATGMSYSGNYSRYTGYGACNGSNQSMTGGYTHTLAHRMTLNLSGNGPIFSQNAAQ